MIILSIDPGIERTGFAIFDKQTNSSFKYLTSGLIKTDKNLDLHLRIEIVYRKLAEIIRKYKPGIMSLERVFFSKNQKTAITVGQSQGVLLLLAAQNGLKVHFFTPNEIKLAVTGYGSADKKSVQKMLRLALRLGDDELKQDDQADAVACGYAYCCLNEVLISH